MMRGMKLLLGVALALLAGGMAVSLSRDPVAPVLTVLLPAGVIALGLFLIAWMMRKEMARFDQEERWRHELLGPPPCSLDESDEAQDHHGGVMDVESGVSRVH